MRALFLCAIVFTGLGIGAGAQAAEQSDSLYLSGEAVSSSAVAGGGGGVDWVHTVSPTAKITVGATSMGIGDERWTYGTLGGFARRHDVWLSGSIGLGTGRRDLDSFPFLRLAGAASMPIARRFSAEIEGQFAKLNGATVKVVKAGTLYGGFRKTSLRAAYVGASAPYQYWQYLFTRADVDLGRAGVLGGLTAGRGPTQLTALGPELLLHTSQEIFVGGSVHVGGVVTTCVAQAVEQAGSRVGRLSVTLQVPLGSRSVATSGTSK